MDVVAGSLFKANGTGTFGESGNGSLLQRCWRHRFGNLQVDAAEGTSLVGTIAMSVVIDREPLLVAGRDDYGLMAQNQAGEFARRNE